MSDLRNARELFLNQRRFDLIFKYLFAQANGTGFPRTAYEESIRRFNGFEEWNSDGICEKRGFEAFADGFVRLIDSLRTKGYDASKGAVPISASGKLVNGAHRLSVAALLGLEVPVAVAEEKKDVYDWRFFAARGMDPKIMDYGALEYVRLNLAAHVVNLFPAADPSRDDEVLAILEKVGFVYYRKEVELTYAGCVNLKKISYGQFWEKKQWIGTAKDGFRGAQSHARQSMRGNGRLRVLVFVCDDVQKVLSAKAEIRALYGLGNPTVHINDTHEEAVRLAETYFNDNSLWILNRRNFEFEDRRFDELVDGFRKTLVKEDADLGDYCFAGSTPLDVVGMRKSDDLDFLSVDPDAAKFETDVYSNHEGQLKYYGHAKGDIISDPRLHFYYHGMKFISMDVLYQLKKTRNQIGKDDVDCREIERLRCGGGRRCTLAERLVIWRKWIYSKVKYGPYRDITVLGFKFTYQKRKRKTRRRGRALSLPPGNEATGVPPGCRVVVYGTDNKIVFREPVARVFEGSVCIGAPDSPASGCVVDIGAGCTSNGVAIRLMEDFSRLEIGRDGMLSENVKIWVSDTHAVSDASGRLLNEGRFVKIGEHVWIGSGAMILKNSNIPSGTIIGAGAVIAGSRVQEENCAVAGNPAAVVKRNVFWHRERPKQWLAAFSS